jgi:hypothetical protein
MPGGCKENEPAAKRRKKGHQSFALLSAWLTEENIRLPTFYIYKDKRT